MAPSQSRRRARSRRVCSERGDARELEVDHGAAGGPAVGRAGGVEMGRDAIGQHGGVAEGVAETESDGYGKDQGSYVATIHWANSILRIWMVGRERDL